MNYKFTKSKKFWRKISFKTNILQLCCSSFKRKIQLKKIDYWA